MSREKMPIVSNGELRAWRLAQMVDRMTEREREAAGLPYGCQHNYVEAKQRYEAWEKKRGFSVGGYVEEVRDDNRPPKRGVVLEVIPGCVTVLMKKTDDKLTVVYFNPEGLRPLPGTCAAVVTLHKVIPDAEQIRATTCPDVLPF